MKRYIQLRSIKDSYDIFYRLLQLKVPYKTSKRLITIINYITDKIKVIKLQESDIIKKFNKIYEKENSKSDFLSEYKKEFNEFLDKDIELTAFLEHKDVKFFELTSDEILKIMPFIR